MFAIVSNGEMGRVADHRQLRLKINVCIVPAQNLLYHILARRIPSNSKSFIFDIQSQATGKYFNCCLERKENKTRIDGIIMHDDFSFFFSISLYVS